MASNTQHPNEGSDSLENIPANISVLFLPRSSELSQKAKEKVLNYYTQGYIHGIKSSAIESGVKVDARCWRSMRKSEQPHKLYVEVCSEQITDSYCSCKVGLSGHCSHVVGLLKSLQGFKLHDLTNVPDQQSCTSVPQQWHVPRGIKIHPVPVNQVVVARPTESRKRRPVLCHFDKNYKIPTITDDDLQQLSGLKGTPLEHRIKGDIPVEETTLGNVQIGSILSYQLNNTSDIRQPGPGQQCGDVSITKDAPVRLPAEYCHLRMDYVHADPHQLEKNTRDQATSELWFEERKYRITASKFGSIVNRKAAPTTPFVKGIFSSGCNLSHVPSLAYGRKHEKSAKERYLQLHPARHLHECGLVINNEFPFLGATPDGKVCDNGQTGIIEIKCPYAARNLDITSACDTLKDFSQEKCHATGKISLKKTHMYYAQVQGQLMVTGCEFCDFVVYTQKDIHVERIQPDIKYMDMILLKLSKFFGDFGVDIWYATDLGLPVCSD